MHRACFFLGHIYVPPTELHRRIRSLLAYLYSDETSAKRIASDAGIDPRRIDFSGKANDIWQSIVAEAEKSGKLQDLLSIAHAEYADNIQLDKLEAFYLAWLKGQQPADKPPFGYPTPPTPLPPVRRKMSYDEVQIDRRVTVIETELKYFKVDLERQFAANRQYTDEQFTELRSFIKNNASPGLDEANQWLFIFIGIIGGGVVFIVSLWIATGGFT